MMAHLLKEDSLVFGCESRRAIVVEDKLADWL